MSNLVNCPACGAKVSVSAKSCPKCGSDVNQGFIKKGLKKIYRCKSCGRELDIDKHHYESTGSYLVDGTTHYTSSFHHVACPYCGDPHPLSGQIAIKNIVIFVVLVFIAISCFSWNVKGPGPYVMGGMAAIAAAIFFFRALTNSAHTINGLKDLRSLLVVALSAFVSYFALRSGMFLYGAAAGVIALLFLYRLLKK